MKNFSEALRYCKYAVEVDKNYAEGYANLSLIYFALGDLDSALDEIKKANSIDKNSKHITKILAIIQAKNNQTIKQSSVVQSNENLRVDSNLFVLNKRVDSKLIAKLYKMKAIELDKIKDPSFGNAKGSDYNLFEDKSQEIKKVAKDLKNLIEITFKNEIHIDDAFYTILNSGGGVKRHHHLTSQDMRFCSDLNIDKYSLVYYLKTGNQKSSDPGILKLFNPSEDFLPHEGMIIIFKADREHSAIYSGNEDRIMIGVNFYSM